MQPVNAKLQRNISFGLFLAINFLFSIKYFGRYTAYYFPLAMGLTAVYTAIWHFSPVFSKLGIFSRYFQLFAIGGLIIASSFVFQRLPQDSINVDRWSVIVSFWDSFFRGEYVYFAKSHLGNLPGPMPVYFIIALPFYLIGEIGYLTLLGPVAFLAVLRYEKWDVGVQNASLVLILGSTFFAWEVAARSALFLNSSLVLFAIVYFLENAAKKGNRGLFISALLIGLCMSTRNVYVIPFLVAMLFALRRRLISTLEFLIIGIAAFAVFAATFIPFVVGHFDEFLVMNPFIIQGTQLIPFSYVLIFVAAGFVAGVLAKSSSDVYFYSGLILFATVVSHFYYKFVSGEAGINELLLANVADISYFVLSAPFLLYRSFRSDVGEPEISTAYREL